MNKKPRPRVRLDVEEAEPRQLLSGLTPVLTTAGYDAVAEGVARAVEGLAATHDTALAAGRLAALSSRIPFGASQLAPGWGVALATYQAGVPGSGLATERLLLADLKRDVAAGVVGGELRVVGPASAAFPRSTLAAPRASLDSVKIQNSTGFTITATVKLSNTTRSITQTIANNGTLPFDFQSSTGNYMTITVKNANGQSPPPYTTNLNRPYSGYNGKSFTVTVFSGYFAVSV